MSTFTRHSCPLQLLHQTFRHQLLYLEKKKPVLWCRGGVPVSVSAVKLQPKGLQHNGDQDLFDKWFLLN